MNNPTLKIESNIPLPPPKRTASGMSSTLRAMKPGDSVFTSDRNQFLSLRCTAYRLHIPIAGREVQGGFRLWRLPNTKKGAAANDALLES